MTMSQTPSSSPLFFLLLLPLLFHCFSGFSSCSPVTNDRYLKSFPAASLRTNISDEYFELTTPFPADPLNPYCNQLILQEDFGNTIGLPPVSVPYSPPLYCSAPWTQVILELNASCRGEQYDRIAGVWLDGVEILRTSTAEPTEAGISWTVRKDVTRYSSLLSRSDLILTMMLENIVNEVYTGVYHVNVSLLYYGGNEAIPPSMPPSMAPSIPPTGSPSMAPSIPPTGSPPSLAPSMAPPSLAPSVAPCVSPSFEAEGFKFNRKLGLLPGITTDLNYQNEIISKESRDRSRRAQITDITYEKPADLVIPISGNGEDDGFWFRIKKEMDVHTKEIQIPLNTYKAVLEIYVSFHGDDEFWYSNPPNSYIAMNNLTTRRGNGAYRRVFATIDGVLVGSTTPFPVIFTGGINPLFWEPIVAIGAFNLPSYDIEITPFLETLLDGKQHSFGLGVTDSLPFWLVDANLHLWLDPNSASVQAKSILNDISEDSMERESKIKNLDGEFKIEAERKTRFSGWVNSSMGNFTTHVYEEYKFENEIKFKNNGQLKEVEQKIEVETQVRVETDTRQLVSETEFKTKYPLKINTSTQPRSENNTITMVTNVSHGLSTKTSFKSPTQRLTSTSSNNQVSGGSMVVQDHSVLSGEATTQQTLSYRDNNGSYSRTVSASNGKLLTDITKVASVASS